ncbi:NAD(P)H-dependent oxidoreductase [Gordonia jinhuaensis]|uniref:Oxidoreductase n=1 Tax=Gordonia jinhuaensis TaxID=1517702 RepID=A0A916WXW8_9ACTN|nr:FMN reductase [Gordonia jinhuaensis]GGB41009.1 oxidoreductase [Gordonia jinhuaensis]
MTRLVVVNAGMSNPSSTRLLADRLTESVAAQYHSATGADLEITSVDLRDRAVDLATSLVSGYGVGGAKEIIEATEDADAVIAVTPVFNASYSGLFKVFFDIVDKDSFAGKPVLIAATGGSPRHSMVLDHALRPMFSYLRAIVLPTGVYAASEDWAGNTGDTATLGDRIDRAAGELADILSGSGRSVRRRPAESAAQRTEDEEEAGIGNFARLMGLEN